MRRDHPFRPMEARDKRLIMKLAVALADFYGRELDAKHFAQATRIFDPQGRPAEGPHHRTRLLRPGRRELSGIAGFWSCR
jgi:hypothetical protein